MNDAPVQPAPPPAPPPPAGPPDRALLALAAMPDAGTRLVQAKAELLAAARAVRSPSRDRFLHR